MKKEIEKRRDYIWKFVFSMVAVVILSILSVIPLVVISYLEENLAYIGVVILLFIVAIAVYIFVSFGNVYGAFEILLQRGDYTPRNKKSDKIISAVASVIWPLTVVAFLIWGFVFHGWWICWILFPIVGILFGAFSALISAIVEDNGEKTRSKCSGLLISHFLYLSVILYFHFFRISFGTLIFKCHF